VILYGKIMSAIQSNLASILFPSYSTTSSKHGAGCNCATCASSASSSGTSSSNGTSSGSGATSSQTASTSNNSSQAANASTPRDAAGKPLSQSQQNEVTELKKTDAAVRRHEQAHLSAAGGYARSGIILNFATGPDGKQYADGGHVDIDTSPVKGNPAATVAKMETVQRAALAPVDPSAQDVRVAAEAGQEANKARAEETQQQLQAVQGGSATDGATSGSTAPNAKAGNLKLSISAKYSKSSGSNSPDDSSFSGQLLDVVG